MYEANLSNSIQIAGEVKGWVQENRGTVNQYIISQVSDLLGKQTSEVQPPLTAQDYRQRQVLLAKVRSFWLEGVLATNVELNFEERSQAIQRPFQDIRDSLQAEQPSSTASNATDVFARMGEGRTLLILGEAGAGKTTTLLKLAQHLVARAEEDSKRPLPVVFSLSSWSIKQSAIADWLIEELNNQYQVSKTLARRWIEEQQLLLLLDGLDEVRSDRRDACVRAINQFLQERGQTEMVICSRIRDYEALSSRLQLRGAIYIQTLVSAQINQYLNSLGDRLQAFKSLFREDSALQELAKSPLILNIIAIAYQDVAIADLSQLNSLKARRRHLFNTYIAKMFARRGIKSPYTPAQTLHWLIWLAQQLSQTSQSLFLIEQMQPTWLPERTRKVVYPIVSLALELSIFAVIGMAIAGRLGGLTAILSAGIVSLSLGQNEEIQTVETLKWSWQEAQKIALSRLTWGASVGLILGLILGLTGQLRNGVISGLYLGLVYGAIAILLLAAIAGFKGATIATKTISNQGIWRSLKNAAIVGAIGGLIGALLGGLVGGLVLGLPNWLWLGLIYGFTVGASFGGGKTCIRHFTLRLLLYFNRQIPWNYSRFLDYACDRIFLVQVGGGYSFIHRILQEHFAEMQLDSSKASGAQIPALKSSTR
jgi:MFS family permease/energy-coupling factor transporter ATP-binding protein EcfA2